MTILPMKTRITESDTVLSLSVIIIWDHLKTTQRDLTPMTYTFFVFPFAIRINQ